MSENKELITVETIIKSNIKKVWDCWTSPECIKEWNHATDDWHTTESINDLTEGGKFLSRMESKDGKMGFDFSGRYDVIAPQSYIEYTLDDNRKVTISFVERKDGVYVRETFEAENDFPAEAQKEGWQLILNSFKKYVEAD